MNDDNDVTDKPEQFPPTPAQITLDGAAYYDEQAMAWRCDKCDAVLQGDGDCPRCDAEDEPQRQIVDTGPTP